MAETGLTGKKTSPKLRSPATWSEARARIRTRVVMQDNRTVTGNALDHSAIRKDPSGKRQRVVRGDAWDYSAIRAVPRGGSRRAVTGYALDHSALRADPTAKWEGIIARVVRVFSAKVPRVVSTACVVVSQPCPQGIVGTHFVGREQVILILANSQSDPGLGA